MQSTTSNCFVRLPLFMITRLKTVVARFALTPDGIVKAGTTELLCVLHSFQVYSGIVGKKYFYVMKRLTIHNTIQCNLYRYITKYTALADSCFQFTWCNTTQIQILMEKVLRSTANVWDLVHMWFINDLILGFHHY